MFQSHGNATTRSSLSYLDVRQCADITCSRLSRWRLSRRRQSTTTAWRRNYCWRAVSYGWGMPTDQVHIQTDLKHQRTIRDIDRCQSNCKCTRDCVICSYPLPARRLPTTSYGILRGVFLVRITYAIGDGSGAWANNSFYSATVIRQTSRYGNERVVSFFASWLLLRPFFSLIQTKDEWFSGFCFEWCKLHDNTPYGNLVHR